MKIEPTFIFAAVLVLGILGYGMTGAAVFNSDSEKTCIQNCAKIVSESAEACLFNGTYFKKDFFANNICLPELKNECVQQFCRPPIGNLSDENFQQCKELCKR